MRELGAVLGIPPTIVGRHPFPGPGLAIRILGEVDAERVAIVQAADAIIDEEIRAAGCTTSVWQAFAVLLPVQDRRRAWATSAPTSTCSRSAPSTSVDGMTADWARLPAELLARMSTRIINEVHGVNRVVYDISSKPPATIEWE